MCVCVKLSLPLPLLSAVYQLYPHLISGTEVELFDA